MQQSSDTLIGCLVGIAIEGIGGSPVWVWRSDRVSGIPNGPLQDGRLFQGESHEFFVREAGAHAAEETRDSMVRAKLRSMLAREYVKQSALPADMWQWAVLRSFAGMSVMLLLAALLGFGAVSAWARRRADEATRLGWRGRVALTLISLSPLALGFGLASAAPETSSAFTGVVAAGAFGGLGVSFALLLMLPLAAALRSRAPEAGLLTAWRGNLRRVLPLAAVGLALISLGLVMVSRTTEARWVRNWMSQTEMERVVATIGPQWHDPPIPADAWRNEPVPAAVTK